MERLTERYVPNDEKKGITGIKVFESENKIPLVKVLSGEYLYPAIEKLADYEDLEEKGWLVRLPDDLNRILYQVNYRWTECTEYGEENNKCEIYDCKCECDSRKEYYIDEVGLQYIPIISYYNRLGKVLFFTHEAAEKKLKERKKND